MTVAASYQLETLTVAELKAGHHKMKWEDLAFRSLLNRKDEYQVPICNVS